jgi:hypothetical protein
MHSNTRHVQSTSVLQYNPIRGRDNTTYFKNYRTLDELSDLPLAERVRTADTVIAKIHQAGPDISPAMLFAYYLRAAVVITVCVPLKNLSDRHLAFLDSVWDYKVPDEVAGVDPALVEVINLYTSAYILVGCGGTCVENFNEADQKFGVIRHAEWLARQ